MRFAPEIERAVGAIAVCTRSTPFCDKIYLVGGVPRDSILGRPEGQDIDLVVEGNALELAAYLHSCRVASLWPVTYPRFGTAMTRVEGMTIELVTARRESYHESSRKPNVEPATIAEDALRRDFTINTLMVNIHSGHWMDPTGRGLRDLAEGQIRTPLDPAQTFFDDPLRMLRAVRFQAQLGFRIETGTAGAIRKWHGRLAVISRERIRDEWNRLLMSPRPARGIVTLARSGLLREFLPALHALEGVDGDGWAHTLLLLDILDEDDGLPVRLAGAIHHVCTLKEASAVLDDLRYSHPERDAVLRLLQLRQIVAGYPNSLPTPGAVRRLVREAGDSLYALLRFCRADRQAGDYALAETPLEELQAEIEDLESIAPSIGLDSPLDGTEIMSVLGVSPGPAVREAKEWLLDQVLEGRLGHSDRELARQILQDRTGRIEEE